IEDLIDRAADEVVGKRTMRPLWIERLQSMIDAAVNDGVEPIITIDYDAVNTEERTIGHENAVATEEIVAGQEDACHRQGEAKRATRKRKAEQHRNTE